MMDNTVIDQLRDCVTGRERVLDKSTLVAWFAERGIDDDIIDDDLYESIGDYEATLVIADALIAANAAPPWAAATSATPAVVTTAVRRVYSVERREWSIATSATPAVVTTAARAALCSTESAQAALDAALDAYDQAHRAAAAAQTMAQAVTYRAAKDVDRARRVVALLAETDRADEEGQ